MKKIELNFGAISIDNATLKGEGYKFYEGLLAQMRQFKESPVQVVQTDIVHNEAIKHIGQEVSKTRSAINQTLRSANKQLKIKSESIDKARELLSIDGEDHEVADGRLKKYYENIGANVIDSSEYVNLALLMEMYFETDAPFETGKDKKNEFPDAIALLSLEGWAEANDINVNLLWESLPDKESLKNLKFAGYETNPLEDNTLDDYFTLYSIEMSRMVALANEGLEISSKIIQLGGSIVNAPAVSANGLVKVMYCHDLDGILMELVQEL